MLLIPFCLLNRASQSVQNYSSNIYMHEPMMRLQSIQKWHSIVANKTMLCRSHMMVNFFSSTLRIILTKVSMKNSPWYILEFKLGWRSTCQVSWKSHAKSWPCPWHLPKQGGDPAQLTKITPRRQQSSQGEERGTTLLLCLSSGRASSSGGGRECRRSGASGAASWPVRRWLGWQTTSAPTDNVEQATAGTPMM
jgi:hypothetical protein